MNNKIELTNPTVKSICTPYQKAEGWYSPDDKSWCWYGGSGVNVKLTDKFSLEGYFAGKTTSSDTDGYLADIIANYDIAKFKSSLADVNFSGQIRCRYVNCGSEKEFIRFAPVKISGKNKVSAIPVDSVYTYPLYGTLVHDFKSSDDTLKFGSIIGVSKNIGKNSSVYFEVEADTKDETFRESSWGITLGYKHTF